MDPSIWETLGDRKKNRKLEKEKNSTIEKVFFVLFALGKTENKINKIHGFPIFSDSGFILINLFISPPKICPRK